MPGSRGDALTGREPTGKHKIASAIAWFLKTIEIIQAIVKGTIAVLIFALAVLVASIALGEAKRSLVVLTPIDAPPDPQLQGLAPANLARRIGDHLEVVRIRARTTKYLSHAYLPGSRYDIQIPGAGISLRGAVELLRTWLRRPEHTVSGEFMRSGERWRFTVRVDGDSARQWWCSTSSVDSVLRLAALYVQQEVEPYPLASYYYDIGDMVSARNVCLFCLQGPPREDDSSALCLLGIIREDQGDFSGAQEEYERASSLGDRSRLPAMNLARIHWKQKEYPDALAATIVALKLDRNFGEAHNMQGLILEAINDVSGAELAYWRAFRCQPELRRAYNNRGLLFSRRGRYDDALAMFELGDRYGHPDLESRSPEGMAIIYREWGRAWAKRGKFKVADSMYAKAGALYAQLDELVVLRRDAARLQREAEEGIK